MMKRILIFVMCTTIMLTLPVVVEAIKDDAMVLYLSFDEGDGKDVEDLSGKGNDGILEGDVKWMHNGKIKSAVYFDEQVQQGVVAVKASNSLAITKSFTMGVWLYPQSVGEYRNIRGQADPHTYYLSLHQGKPSVWIGSAGAGGGTWNSAKNIISQNRWSHVAAVYEFNKELRIYINGELDETHKLEGEIPVSQADHWFGNRLDGAWPYKGMLDEFVIYNRVLTKAEIKQDMDQVLSVSPLEKAATTWGMLKMLN